MDGLLFILALAFIIVAGHFLWLALAALIRFLSGSVPREEPAPPPRKRTLSQELTDLEITTHTIRQLLAHGDLDAETANRVSHALEARRRALQPEPAVPVPRPPRLVPASSLAQLEELLGGRVHPRELPLERRREALACYRLLNNSQRAALKGATLLAVARLLELAGMTSHALNAYRRLLDEHPGLPTHALIALEAARLAVREEQVDLARRCLRLALSGVLPEAEYSEAQELVRRFEESMQKPAPVAVAPPQEILDAIPVESTAKTPLASAAILPALVAPLPTEPLAVLPAPSPPRRSLTNVLAAFMEDRNILWGELTGGLLIVGCSIALVITLWHSLESLPYFPFLIFACITAALFCAGEYTLHHWKLESTSRGLLVIALLLVPLNLLVLADPSLGPADTALEWIFKIAAICLALGMVRLSGRDLIGVGVLPGPIDRRWLFMLAIVGAAGSQLIVPRLLDEEHPVLYVVLACVPVACHVLASGAVVAGLARTHARSEHPRLEVRQANSLFVFLGLSSFTLFVALGFLLSRSTMAIALPRLAEPFALASVPILAGGLLVRRGLPREESGLRTAGTAVAFTGLAFMLSAVVLAWPLPLPLLLVCLSNAVLLTVLALRWRLPYAHAVALPCLALAVLLVVQLSLGHLVVPPEIAPAWWLAEQLTSPTSGLVLAILMFLCAAGAEALLRSGERLHAASYALGSGGLGIVALLTTACHGIESPWPAAFVHVLAGVCALTLYARWKCSALPYTGLSLFVAASMWALWAMTPHNLALWGFVLALESALLVILAVPSHSLRGACRDIAIAAAILALGVALFAPGFPDQRLHTGTAALLAVTAFVLAHLFRLAELTWLGSTFVFAAVAHLLIWNLDAVSLPRPLLMALLAHATLALLGRLLLQARNIEGDSTLRAPLHQSAILTSLLAVPLLFVPGIAPLVQAGYALWLAVLWLLVAGLQRSPVWFNAFQMAVSVSVVFAANACTPQWVWFDPYCLQAYGIGLGLLGLGWIVARMVLLKNPRVRELWEAPWPSLDRVMLGVLVVGQFALALWGILPGLDAEMMPVGYISSIEWPSSSSHAYGWGAWGSLAMLSGVLLAALREKGHTSILVGLLLLAVTMPILAAGPFASQRATASALRWGLALCYLACSVLVWLRPALPRLAASAGVELPSDSSALLWAHGILAFVAISLLLLTAQVAVVGLSGLRPSGPAPGSIFAEIGWTLSHVLPLIVLTLGLVGHAVRERWPVYAFLAGLVANLSLTGGYALAVVTAGRHLETADIVCLWQLASLTAALWVLAWIMSLPWLRIVYGASESSEGIPSPLGLQLMLLLIGLALGGQLIVLGRAVFFQADWTGSLTTWATAAGSSLGWASLLASLAALMLWYRQQTQRMSWGWLFAGGLAAVSLLACTVERSWPGAGIYFLLMGWPVYVLLWSALPAMNIERHSLAARASWLSFIGFTDAAPVILLPNLVSLFWALQVAIARHEYLWAAAAVSVCAAAAALLAAAQRNEALAFLAGLGANLATSLVVWHLYSPSLPSWIAIVQANVIASSGVALAWLELRRLLAERQSGQLLPIQAWLGLGMNTAMLILPLLRIQMDPGTLPVLFLAEIGSPAGWLALLLSAAAAYRHASLSTPRGRLHVLGIAGLSVGILAACTVSPWDIGSWRSFHVLLMTWCALGLAATIAGSVMLSAPVPGRFTALFQPGELPRWLEGIGLAILVIVLPSCWTDPQRPIAPAAAILTVSGMAGMLALWSRRSHYVWISGLLIDLIGVLFWSSRGPDTVIGFLLANALGLAAAGALWIAVGLSQVRDEGSPIIRLPHSSFAVFAVNAALGLVALVVLLLLGSDLLPPRILVSASFAWCTLATVGAALALVLAERRSSFAPPGLYILGLSAIGLALHEGTRSPAGLGWCAALALAGYVTAASLIAALSRRSRDPWFLPAQASVAGLVVALSLWMCLDFAACVDRLAGPVAVLLLIPAALVLSRPEKRVDTLPQALEQWLRPVVLILGVLAAAEIGWACPDPAGATPWLHRNVLLMVALAGMTALYGFALPRWLAHDDEWVRCGRRFGPLLGILASLTLLLLLVQELRLYDAATRRTPMVWPEILVIVAALVILMVSGIRFAVVPLNFPSLPLQQRKYVERTADNHGPRTVDPLKRRRAWSRPLRSVESGRTLYVYGVELLLVLFFVHVRITVPELFSGWLVRYWMFVVMLIAFGGVGLSELFERRKLPVLAEPLQRTGVFLPLLPLLAFWVRPSAPALPPLLNELQRHPLSLNSYALLWLLVSGLYLFVSLTRRSFLFALLAALAGNFALWSLLAHHSIEFLLHPQCWLIPPALILLAAEHVNRDRLRSEISTGLRYLGISMIYVSSTADLFLTGLGQSIILPIVLAVLSLAGILLGILFRIRAFLFLGISFLFLDVFTMIWYAAVDRYQTWVWWVSGIVLGAAILTLFAVFEKRRNDVLHLLEEIKHWD